jgi:hypothetical protein
MVEAIHLIYGGEATSQSIPDTFMLRQLFMRLFTGRGIEFFDAESDDEFLSVFDGARNIHVEERKKVLGDFKSEVTRGQQFFGEYGKMSEIMIQSEDYLENIRVPFLMFNLSDEDDLKDPTYDFRLDTFHVFYVTEDHFVVVLYMRNTMGNHLEVYLRFERDEALKVVRTILSVFEEYMGCDGADAPCHSIKDMGVEEMYTHLIQRFNETQLKPTKGPNEMRLRNLGFCNLFERKHGS